MTIHDMLNTTALLSRQELEHLYAEEQAALGQAGAATEEEQRLLERKQQALQAAFDQSVMQQTPEDQALKQAYASPAQPVRMNGCTIPTVTWLGVQVLNGMCSCKLDYWDQCFTCCRAFDTFIGVLLIPYVLYTGYIKISELFESGGFIFDMRYRRYRRKVMAIARYRGLFNSGLRDVGPFFRRLDSCGGEVPEYTDRIMNQIPRINKAYEDEYNECMSKRVRLSHASLMKHLRIYDQDLAHFISGGK